MAHDSKPQETAGGARQSSFWTEEIERVDRRGTVYVRLRNGDRSLRLRVSAPGTDQRVLARTRFGDVSYTEAAGVAETAAAKLGRAYAARMESRASPLPARLPHLAVSAGGERTPGACRTAVAELWPRNTALPAARDALCLEPAGLVEFLAPELRLDMKAAGGFVLRAVHPAPSGEGAACVLEFDPPPEMQRSGRVLIDVGTAADRNESFGGPHRVWIAPRCTGSEPGDHLDLPVADLCSWLVALLELKQSADFTVSRPAAPSTSGAPPLAIGDAGAGPTPSLESRAPSAIQDVETELHRFSILASGFTMLRHVLDPNTVERLSGCVDRALEATRKAVAAGRNLPYTFYDEATYLGTRCVYCWGDECVALLENEKLARIAEAVVGPHRLFDMSALRALPSGSFAGTRTEWWHRDIDVLPNSSSRVRYLWFFVLLDDFTADNGATWIVPGSQRLPNEAIPKKKHFPTGVQLLGQAGDVIALNPSALHTVGHNVTARPRTIINFSVCHADVPPLMDHWSIAGPAIQDKASPRIRRMLGADDRPPDVTWAVLPDGWVTSHRTASNTPSERNLPAEQQGYQRQHHMRDGVLLPDRPGNRPEDDGT